MHVHILGIGGTFMGGLAQLARAAGHRVTGADGPLYPPMSTQLAEAGIEVIAGYQPEQLTPPPDQVIVGNVMRRGIEVIEAMLNAGLDYTSGPQWLSEHVLRGRWVLAVAGTHGKTTTASLLVHILEQAGLSPGFLIGGVPANFGVSARLTQSPFFVVEADEYDTAFFDKRSKFVHYHPRTLVLNNLEFDHADIFPDLQAIKRQFHHLVRTVPGHGLIVNNAENHALAEVLAQGCWTPIDSFGPFKTDGAGWQVRLSQADGSRFEIFQEGKSRGEVQWGLLGQHNAMNALAALLAARHVGVPLDLGLAALPDFRGVARRLESLGKVAGVHLYDDFAHHPTAIATTLEGLRDHIGSARLVAVVEPRSNTMRLGAHRNRLAGAVEAADRTWFYQPPDLGWSLEDMAADLGSRAVVEGDLERLSARLIADLQPGDHVVFMSNGGFGGLPRKVHAALAKHEDSL